MNVGRNCKKKDQVLSRFRSTRGNNASGGAIENANMLLEFMLTQRQWSRPKFHAAGSGHSIPWSILPCMVLFPQSHPGKIASAKTVTNTQTRIPVDRHDEFGMSPCVQLHPGDIAISFNAEGLP
jgi:hypothetical protein